MKLIVSDTTSLIVLDELKSLDLLCRLFECVLIPEAVFSELQVGSPAVKATLEKAGCFELITLENSEQLLSLKLVLDAGESEAIALAVERKLPVLIDERKGRQIARQLKLTVTGFAGILILAVRKDVLSADEAIALMDQAMNNGYCLSEKLYRQVVDTLKELS
ncbi:hypothetical protein EOL70_15110 [Leucothrix sargassi]|nr:hypothetical protein EOL70_15110 [Leucothrix sargassi]